MELVDITEDVESVITQDFESEQPKVSEETILLSGSHGQAALLRLKESEKLWTESFDLLRRTTQPLGAPVDVLELNITDKTIDQMRDEVLDRLVSKFVLRKYLIIFCLKNKTVFNINFTSFFGCIH